MGETHPPARVFDKMGVCWAEIADRRPMIRQVNFLKSALKTKSLILDLCCGTTHHSILLGKEGYHMIGLDMSLLRIAEEKAAEAHMTEQPAS
ncbi:hypothetical protein G4O51_09285 [Candidatus Bathyarchaeota archaeon A05DMB-2]|nr:hypothetical protein [Candidatus Bathyarchaeota archaeon A05DMB-2]